MNIILRVFYCSLHIFHFLIKLMLFVLQNSNAWLIGYVFAQSNASLRPNNGNILRGKKTVFTRSAITPLKVNGFGWNLEHCEYIVVGWPRQILGAIRAVATVWEIAEIARFHPLCVGNSRYLNRTTSIGVPVKTFGTEFCRFYRKGSFFQKKRKIAQHISRSCDFGRATITPQRLQIARNSVPK